MLLLASQSPQRAHLLAGAGIAFRVVGSRCDEETVVVPGAETLALERARCKARGALAGDGEAVALGADTVVALGDDCLGKPRDRADAVAMLSRLQGTTHRVLTGHCCARFFAGRVVAEASAVATTEVTMRPMSAAEIRAYVDSGESDGRAGAYAIQESGDRFVAALRGAFDTVVGLHVDTVVRLHLACAGIPPQRT